LTFGQKPAIRRQRSATDLSPSRIQWHKISERKTPRCERAHQSCNRRPWDGVPVSSCKGTFKRMWCYTATNDRPSEKDMAKSLAYVAAALSLFAVTAPADAKGCIKGAIVGGVAGHFAGHHGTLGAAAGCVIGHHEANKPTNPQPSTTGSTPRSAPR
jgi:hypothetical protein